MAGVKRLLALLLVCVMAFGLMPATSFAQGDSQELTGTDVFKGAATYLMHERFTSPLAIGSDNSNRIISGWDVDYRGGSVTKSNGKLHISDENAFEKISMNHKVMNHSGDDLVLETAFSYTLFVSDGFYYEVGGEDKTALKLLVKDGYLCIEKSDGKYQQLVKCQIDTTYAIKAVFSNTEKEVSLWIDGEKTGTFAYNQDTNVIDEIEIGTTKEQVAQIYLDYVYMYVNYIINENFVSVPIGSVPEWVRTIGGSVCLAPGAPYGNDLKGFSIPAEDKLDIDFPYDIPSDWEGVAYSWDMYLPEDTGDITVLDDFKVSGGKFYFDSKEVYDYTKNVWYRLQIVDYGTRADLFVNNVKTAESEGFVDSGTFCITNNSEEAIIVDNITVSKAFDKADFSDYPSAPDVVKSDDYHIGMIFYPMWREGIHYGWDLITPYEERTPYLGYYTGGSREAADWDSKWLLEHGFDHAIFPFVRPDADGAVGYSVRGEALHDGYLTSVYKDQLDFAVMITNPTTDKYESGTEFIENVEPFIVEHYFKNPSYKSIDNRLVLYCYNFKGIAECFGDTVTGTTAEVDYTQMDMVLNSLDAAAKKIDNGKGGKYDGITFIADISVGGTKYADDYISKYDFGEHVLKWRYTWGTDKPGTVINGIKDGYESGSNYVASIPMGFDNTPWKSNKVGMMSPDQISEICEAVKQNKGTDDPNIAVLTCWDEWGEGHFHAPSEYGGFGYLNAVRKNFTDSGEKTNQERPSEEALKRIGVLFPEGRQILKVKLDRRVYTVDVLDNLTVKNSKNIYNLSGYAGGASVSTKTINGKNSNVYTITSPDQMTVSFDMSGLNMDISDISAIKINGYAENSATMVVYMQTDKTEGTSDIYPTTLRFEGATDGTKTVSDTVLIPDNPDKLTGTLKRIRFNPAAKTAVGSEIYINSITFYTGNMETEVYVDDKEYVMVSAPAFKNDTVYVPAYRLLLDLDAYPLWDKATKTLTVEKDDTTLELKAGSTTVKVNGESKAFKNAPYYDAGNLWVPYDELLKEFGYTVTFDSAKNEINYKSKNYDAIKNYVNDDNVWTFDLDGFTEGWGGSHLIVNPPIVKNGMMHVAAKTNDPIIEKNALSIPKAKAKYAVIKFRNTGNVDYGLLRLYDGKVSATGVVYKYDVKASDEIQEVVIDLENGVYLTNTYTNTYESLADTITGIRIDPINNLGNMYIDSIGIYAERPGYDFEVDAYGYNPENMFQLDTNKNGYGFSNMPSTNNLPATETVDDYENVLKIVPNSGKENCIFTIESVWYEGGKQKVNAVSSDNRLVKVSFWYKGIGDTTKFRLENRASSSLDGEMVTVSDVSTTQWKYYEGYYDMSKVGNTDRWFSLRVYQGKAGGLYVRDYKYLYFDEETPLEKLTGGKMKFGVSKLYDEEIPDGKIYIAEYDESNIMTKITAYESGDELTPSSDTESVKCFFWNGLKPLSDIKVLTK